MLSFWLVAAAFIAVALVFVLLPLLRRDPDRRMDTDTSNLAVYRDQRIELDADLERGTISAEQHAQARSELERRLLEDMQSGSPGERPPASTGSRRVAIAVAIVIPAIAVGLYLLLGNTDALVPSNRLGMTEEQAASRQKMLDLTATLATRMQARPDDATGWTMLGRAWMSLQRFPEAVQAYARAAQIRPDDAGILAEYAESLTMAQGGRFDGEVPGLVARALASDPRNDKALAIAGTIAFESGRFAEAIALWRRLLALAPPDGDYARAIGAGIAEAEAALARSRAAPPAAGATSVSGTVTLAPSLVGKAAPDDTVFVFARASQGPRMPLAILRKQVRDLPLTFTLDDSMAMSPASRISGAASVIVGARISKSGNAMPQAGDLEGASAAVAPGATGLKIVIERTVQ